MPFDGSKTKEILALCLEGISFLAVPCLTVLAYRGWTKGLRQGLPRWRNALGMASIVVTFLSWFGLSMFALFVLLDRIGLKTNFFSFSPDWMPAIALLVLAGTSLAFALKGASRIEAIVAGLLMVAAWMTSVVS
jgi:hypothetical protein